MIHWLKAKHLHKYFSSKRHRTPRSCKKWTKDSRKSQRRWKVQKPQERQTFPEKEQLFLSPEDICFAYLRVLLCDFSCLHIWEPVFINFWSGRLRFLFCLKVSNWDFPFKWDLSCLIVLFPTELTNLGNTIVFVTRWGPTQLHSALFTPATIQNFPQDTLGWISFLYSSKQNVTAWPSLYLLPALLVLPEGPTMPLSAPVHEDYQLFIVLIASTWCR